MLRILHTSDWHLGRSLLSKRRYTEHTAFLDWLINFIDREKITILLVAGDVFDSATPSNAAQQQYYDFLTAIGQTACRHVVITAGNHDSPSFLSASRGILQRCGVHVVGATPKPEETVIVLDSPAEEGGSAIVCAVPFLREREILPSMPGENMDERERRFLEGVRRYYHEAATVAEERRQSLGADVPIIVMGHLFTAGGTIEEGDGVRTLQVGSLQGIPAGIFPSSADYVALGHLHSAQLVGGNSCIRYCGSPFPMSFNEAGRRKKVCLATALGQTLSVQEVEVPCFQRLEKIQGDLAAITERLLALVEDKESVWVEVEYIGSELIGDLRDQVYSLTEGSSVEVLRIKDRRMMAEVRRQQAPAMPLEEMNEETVFLHCLEEKQIPEEQREGLLRLYHSIRQTVHEAGEDQ